MRWLRCGFVGCRARESVKQQQGNGDYQHADDKAVQLAAGLAGNGLTAVHILLALEPFGRQLVGPGEEQRKRKADEQQEQDQPGNPVRQGQDRHHDVGDLQHQPGQHDVCDSYPENVAPLEFLKDGQSTSP